MLVIKVQGLPQVPEDQLRGLYLQIVISLLYVRELNLKDGREVTCLFPANMMFCGLGEEIIVEVILCEKLKCPEGVCQKLASTIGRVVRAEFPQMFVRCLVHPVNPKQGFWSSHPG